MKELNHAECIDRDLKDWKKIFSLSLKAYGYRINAYKGNQKLIYIPDMIGEHKVAFIHENIFGSHEDVFSSDCAIICNKRIWDKLDPECRLTSALVYINDQNTYPDPYASVVKSFITRNKDLVIKRLLSDDDPVLFTKYLQLTVKRINQNTIKEYLERDDIGIQIKACLLNLTQTGLEK